MAVPHPVGRSSLSLPLPLRRPEKTFLISWNGERFSGEPVILFGLLIGVSTSPLLSLLLRANGDHEEGERALMGLVLGVPFRLRGLLPMPTGEGI